MRLELPSMVVAVTVTVTVKLLPPKITTVAVSDFKHWTDRYE